MPNDIDPHFNWIPIWGWCLNVGSSRTLVCHWARYDRIFSIPKIGLENRMVRIFSFNGGTPSGLMCRGAPGTNPRMRQAPPLARIAFGDDFALIIDDFDHGGRPTPQKWPLNAPLPKVVRASKSVMCFGCSSRTNMESYLMQWRRLEGRRGHGFEWHRFLTLF